MTARIQHNTAQRRDVVNPPDPHWAVRTFSGFSPDKSGEVSPISRLCAARGNERIKLKLRLQLVAEDVWKVGWGVDCTATRQHCTALYNCTHPPPSPAHLRWILFPWSWLHPNPPLQSQNFVHWWEIQTENIKDIIYCNREKGKTLFWEMQYYLAKSTRDSNKIGRLDSPSSCSVDDWESGTVCI